MFAKRTRVRVKQRYGNQLHSEAGDAQEAGGWGALAVAPPLFGGEAAPAAKRGFKIGAVDWELTKANDPGAFKVAAKLGFDGLQVDLGTVAPMRDPARQKLFMDHAKEHKVEIASLAMGIVSEVRDARMGRW